MQRTEEGLYKEVRRCFSSSWDKSLKRLDVKKSGPNYSSSSPLVVLQRTDSDIITSSVLDITKSEELTGEYYDSFFKIVEKPLPEKLEACAAGVGKAVDDLTDEETAPLADEMADALLSQMTELLQQTQSVPEIAQIQKKNPQEEDFSDQWGKL